MNNNFLFTNYENSKLLVQTIFHLHHFHETIFARLEQTGGEKAFRRLRHRASLYDLTKRLAQVGRVLVAARQGQQNVVDVEQFAGLVELQVQFLLYSLGQQIERVQHRSRIAVALKLSLLQLQNVRLDQALQVALVDLVEERQLSVHDVLNFVPILAEHHPKIAVIAQADQRQKQLLLRELFGQLQQTGVNSTLMVDLHHRFQVLHVLFLWVQNELDS